MSGVVGARSGVVGGRVSGICQTSESATTRSGVFGMWLERLEVELAMLKTSVRVGIAPAKESAAKHCASQNSWSSALVSPAKIGEYSGMFASCVAATLNIKVHGVVNTTCVEALQRGGGHNGLKGASRPLTPPGAKARTAETARRKSRRRPRPQEPAEDHGEGRGRPRRGPRRRPRTRGTVTEETATALTAKPSSAGSPGTAGGSKGTEGVRKRSSLRALS
jgi:hypothetical protein